MKRMNEKFLAAMVMNHGEIRKIFTEAQNCVLRIFRKLEPINISLFSNVE